jgi:hypothetical protein
MNCGENHDPDIPRNRGLNLNLFHIFMEDIDVEGTHVSVRSGLHV